MYNGDPSDICCYYSFKILGKHQNRCEPKFKSNVNGKSAYQLADELKAEFEEFYGITVDEFSVKCNLILLNLVLILSSLDLILLNLVLILLNLVLILLNLFLIVLSLVLILFLFLILILFGYLSVYLFYFLDYCFK